MLDVPAYIADARIASADARYVWDEWNVRSYFMIADEAELARFDALTGKANTALLIAVGEWICERFSALSADSRPLSFLEAAWAGAIDLSYCVFTETVDDEWRGPIRGPLAITIQIANDALFHLVEEPRVAPRVCWMVALARHVLPNTDAFEAWLEKCVRRLETYHSKSVEKVVEQDLFEPLPGQGTAVPRAALNPDFRYDPAQAAPLLDAFLRNLDPTSNPYLRHPKEVAQYGARHGIPYRYP